MSGFDELWGDDLTDIDVAECLEVETQASQVPTQLTQQISRLQNIRGHTNVPGSSLLSSIPRILDTQPYKLFRDDHQLRTSASSSNTSTSSSSSPSFIKLSENQRKLKTPVRSLPEISSQSKEKVQAATTEKQLTWLRSELEKRQKTLFDLEQNKRTLEGEVKLLRERNKNYQNQVVKVREQTETDYKQKEEKMMKQLKEKEREAESAKIQLALKTKESEANLERYLELKNVSVLEPDFPHSQVTFNERHRSMCEFGRARTVMRPETKATNASDDYEDDYFSDRVFTKKLKRDQQSDLKTFSCDELIRAMDQPKATQSNTEDDKPVEIDITLSETISPLKPSLEQDSESKLDTVRIVDRMEASVDLGTKFPWLKSKCYSLSAHHGQLLNEKISDRIYTLSEPEVKIIVTPALDFDPSNVLKMDCSDLQYLEDLEKGEKIWGVDLKTMYDTDKQISEAATVEPVENDDALETVKTILGSQMCSESPDQTRLNESLTEPHSPGDDTETKVTKHKLPKSDESILLKNLEPIHVHLKALTKLSHWDTSMDLISSIVLHLTSMVNELHERVCDPRIPDQLKDQFYNNEFATGNLFMNGPYEQKDLLSHEKWTERERYVELRRGLAVLAILCFLNRDTANLVLDSTLLNDVSKSNNRIITSKNAERSYLQDSYLTTTLRNQSQRKIQAKAEVSSTKFIEILNIEDKMSTSQKGRNVNSYLSNSPGPSTSMKTDCQAIPNIPNEEIIEMLMAKTRDDDKLTQVADNVSIGSASTVNGDEIMDVDSEVVVDENRSSGPRSIDEVNHESFKAWYDLYTQNRSNFTMEEQHSGSKSQKYNKILDPELTDSQRKELSVYLKRRKCYKDYYKAVAEKGAVWVPEKSDEGDNNLELSCVKNLYDYENKVSNINMTITSDELISMKPGSFHPVNENSVGDSEITVKSQEGSSAENEWRVNSLQKNQEDPNLTKVGELKKPVDDKNWSFFEKFKTTSNDSVKTSATNHSNVNNNNSDSRLKPSTSKLRKHSLAPLKKRGGRDSTPPPESLTNINKEMEMEVEMLYDKTSNEKVDRVNERGDRQILNVMAPFNPEYRFPETTSDCVQKSDTLAEYLTGFPKLDDPDFQETFCNLYNQSEEISGRLNMQLKSFSRLMINSYIEGKKAVTAEEAKKKNEVRRPKKIVNSSRDEGPSGVSTFRNQDESDAIITMLNGEALKYSLKKNIKMYEKKKGNLNILDGIHEIVYAINCCRLTLVFYPLLSSCVTLMESLFKQSFNNNYFERESFILIMKILNETTCCQPPPDIIEKILGVLTYAVKFPDIIECLCKKRSNLVSLVAKTEFLFFKGVCMMQPLCYLVGSLSQTCYPQYWSLSLIFTRWLRQLYEKYRMYLEAWYPPSSVCNCVPVLHTALFSTLAKATSFRANHGSDLMADETLKNTVDDIIRDGIRLCEILIELDNSFKTHLAKFDLYHEFLCTAKDMHYDPNFFPSFQLEKNELAVVECLIKANEMLARSGPLELLSPEPDSSQDTKNTLNQVIDSNHVFLSCADKYDLLC